MGRLQEIQRLSGVGSVFSGEKKVAEVRYDLRVVQKMVDDKLGGEIPGLKRTRGFVSSADPGVIMRLSFMERLTLVLEDGRKLDISVSGRGAVEAMGAFY